MAKGFAINNSMTSHGGIIKATQQRTSQMGNLFLRADDGHFCPKCKCWSKIVKSHDHIIMDGKAVAYVDDLLTCGAKILPKQNHVVGDSQGSNYRSSSNTIHPLQNNFVNQVTPTLHGIVYQLIDEYSNKPIVNMYYQLIDADGNIVEGNTDENGNTKEITTGSSAQEIQFLTYDLSKPLPPMD